MSPLDWKSREGDLVKVSLRTTSFLSLNQVTFVVIDTVVVFGLHMIAYSGQHTDYGRLSF